MHFLLSAYFPVQIPMKAYAYFFIVLLLKESSVYLKEKITKFRWLLKKKFSWKIIAENQYMCEYINVVKIHNVCSTL